MALDADARRVRRKLASLKAGLRPSAPASKGTPDQLIAALRTLSVSKQAQVLEAWPGVEYEAEDGVKVTARSKKELIRYRHGQSSDVLDWIRSFEAGEVFYDVGANVGSISLSVGAIHRDRVRIVAIEPGFASFEALVRNLSRNGMLGFAIPLQLALHDQTGLEPMNYYRSTSAGTSLHAVGEAVEQEGRPFAPVEVQLVPAYELDDLIELLGLPRPTRIKIDIDGGEEAMLLGAARVLEAGTVRELAIEVCDHDRRGTRLASITAFLEARGYEFDHVFPHSDPEGFVADHLFRRIRDAAPREGARDPAQGEESKLARARKRVRLAEERAAAAEARAEVRLSKLRAKLESSQTRAARVVAERDALSRELADLRRSYYLSGARKKIDVSRLDDFSQIVGSVVPDGRTKMGVDRLYTLWQAARDAPSGYPFVEVGVFRGGSARFLAETLRSAGLTSTRLYVCDTFAGHASTDPDLDTAHHENSKFTGTSVEDVREYLAGYANVEIVPGDIEQSSRVLAGQSFAFAHIDVDVYRATDFCLRFFAPRLAPRAIMVIDDYGFVTCPGVKKAVDDFVQEFREFRLLHLLTGQAVVFQSS